MPVTRGDVNTLVTALEAGEIGALARAITLVENRLPQFHELLARLHPRVGRAHRVGITGPPGAGKSTLTERLVGAYRRRDLRVGVVAVDPTSPFSGGALLGDRVRMDAVAQDDGVFIRSMATRGSAGGLATTTQEVADVLDATGFDRILIETVGVGQSELAIAASADTTILVLVPESGDGVQVLKAGVMEIADVFVVNKADRPGAHKLARDVEELIQIRHEREPADTHDRPHAVLLTAAVRGEGVTELADAVEAHGAWLRASGRLREQRRRRLAFHTRDVVDRAIRQGVWSQPEFERRVNEGIERVVRGETSPYQLADDIVASVLGSTP